MQLPRLLGDVTDSDTQFMAMLKQYQHWLFVAICGLGILMVFLLVLTFTAGPQGTWRFGVCKVFLERYAQYPTDIKILTAGEKQSSAQIGYMITNAYGSRESQLIECFYNIGATGVRLGQVTIDRKPVAQSFIDEFNPTIDIILFDETLDKTLPPRLPNDLEDLKQSG